MVQDSNKLLGFLVNITKRGIMIMSERPIKTGKTFHLQILIPSDDEKKNHLKFAARSIWCERSVNTDFYDTGLELMNVNIDQFEAIDNIITELGFNE
jgi:hypothetical protein